MILFLFSIYFLLNRYQTVRSKIGQLQNERTKPRCIKTNKLCYLITIKGNFYTYCPKFDRWFPLKSPDIHLEKMLLKVLAGNVYLINFNNNGSVINIMKYDITYNYWSNIENPNRRGRASIFACGERLLCLYLNEILILNDEKWELLINGDFSNFDFVVSDGNYLRFYNLMKGISKSYDIWNNTSELEESCNVPFFRKSLKILSKVIYIGHNNCLLGFDSVICTQYYLINTKDKKWKEVRFRVENHADDTNNYRKQINFSSKLKILADREEEILYIFTSSVNSVKFYSLLKMNHWSDLSRPPDIDCIDTISVAFNDNSSGDAVIMNTERKDSKRYFLFY